MGHFSSGFSLLASPTWVALPENIFCQLCSYTNDKNKMKQPSKAANGFPKIAAVPPSHGDLYGGQIQKKINATAKEANVDKEMLQQYLNLEKQIQQLEKDNPLSTLDVKQKQLKVLDKQLLEQEDNLAKIEEEVAKEKADVDELENEDVKECLMKMGTNLKEKYSKEQQEYLAALNKQEIAKTELDNLMSQKKNVEKDIKSVETKAGALQDLYKKQDDLLDRIFGGEYGSVEENTIEQELDYLELQRSRVMEASFKWRQAQMMLDYACKQLAVAVQKWKDLPDIPQLNLEERFKKAEETRNNLVAAGQNIAGAQRYLPDVKFPYCSPEEVDTLSKATAYVFTDMQSPERHAHAGSCYNTTNQRAAALLQWFDQVLNTTILRDLNDINNKVKQKTIELRQERIKLIKEKMKEIWGKDADLDLEVHGISETHDEDTALILAELNKDEVAMTEGIDDVSYTRLPNLADDQLAPMPSTEDLFGQMYALYEVKMSDLQNQHKKQLEKFMTDQEVNQQRVNQDLQEKLNARRQRRARQRLEEVEKEQLVAA